MKCRENGARLPQYFSKKLRKKSLKLENSNFSWLKLKRFVRQSCIYTSDWSASKNARDGGKNCIIVYLLLPLTAMACTINVLQS